MPGLWGNLHSGCLCYDTCKARGLKDCQSAPLRSHKPPLKSSMLQGVIRIIQRDLSVMQSFCVKRRIPLCNLEKSINFN